MTNEITIRALLSSFAMPAPMLNTQTDRAELIYDNRAALFALDDRLELLFAELTDPAMIRHLDYLIDDFHADPFFHLFFADRIAALFANDEIANTFPSIDDFTPAHYDFIITDDDLRSMMQNEFADHTDDCDACAELDD